MMFLILEYRDALLTRASLVIFLKVLFLASVSCFLAYTAFSSRIDLLISSMLCFCPLKDHQVCGGVLLLESYHRCMTTVVQCHTSQPHARFLPYHEHETYQT